MKTIRKMLGLLPLAVAIALMMSAVGSAQEFRFRLSHPLQTTDDTHKAMLFFADNVKKRSNGRIAISVFPADQLGRQKDVGEMIVQGANVMQFSDALFVAEWVPDAAILQAPFLLNDPDEWGKILKSPWMADLRKRLAEKGAYVLSFNNYFGSRNIIGNKPIRTPADLAGVTLREANTPMYVKFAESLGARPVVMGFAEVYTAFSQNVVDMVECPLQTAWASKFFEQRKVASLTFHMINWAPLIMNTTQFNKLPLDLQKIMVEEAERAGDYVTEMKKQGDKEIILALEKAGVTVVKDVDREAFKQVTQKVYDQFPEWTPGLTATVRALLAK